MNLRDDEFLNACFELDFQNQYNSKSEDFISIHRMFAAMLFIRMLLILQLRIGKLQYRVQSKSGQNQLGILANLWLVEACQAQVQFR